MARHRRPASLPGTGKLLAALLTTTALVAAPAMAADIYWDQAAASHDWATGTNWLGGTAPTAADVARIEWPAGVLPTFQPWLAGPVTVSGLRLGASANTVGTLVVYDSLTVTGDTRMADGNATLGNIAVRGGGTATLNTLSLGIGGPLNSGNIYVDTGGVLNLNGAASIGVNSDGNGLLRIKDAGSVLTVGAAVGTLIVGQAGTGTLEILNGAHATLNSALSAGNSTGGNGQVVVRDAGSTLDGTSMVLGAQGHGGLQVLNGAHATLSSTLIAGNDPSLSGQGQVVVSGTNGPDVSTLSVSGFAMGYAGYGEMTIANGGRVETTGGGNHYIGGGGSAGTGIVTVTGPGSMLDASGTLLLGGATGASGTLNVLAGGVAHAYDVSIGHSAGSTGAVTVDGVGSTLVAGSSDIHVGNSGTGSLTVSNGGAVTAAGILNIALDAGSIGTLNIGAAAASPAAAAGTVAAATGIAFGAGTGTINFNHTDSSISSLPPSRAPARSTRSQAGRS